MKKNWRKPVMAAAACLLIVGGVIGGTEPQSRLLNAYRAAVQYS